MEIITENYEDKMSEHIIPFDRNTHVFFLFLYFLHLKEITEKFLQHTCLPLTQDIACVGTQSTVRNTVKRHCYGKRTVIINYLIKLSHLKLKTILCLQNIKKKILTT